MFAFYLSGRLEMDNVRSYYKALSKYKLEEKI